MPLRRIVVDAAVRVAVRDELRHLGIDRAALFPDLDGIARGHNARLCLLEEDELAATRA
jgi:hypothetical protein